MDPSLELMSELQEAAGSTNFTFSQQTSASSCFVQILQHLVFDNNLYIISEQCQESLRSAIQTIVLENFK